MKKSEKSNFPTDTQKSALIQVQSYSFDESFSVRTPDDFFYNFAYFAKLDMCFVQPLGFPQPLTNAVNIYDSLEMISSFNHCKSIIRKDNMYFNLLDTILEITPESYVDESSLGTIMLPDSIHYLDCDSLKVYFFDMSCHGCNGNAIPHTFCITIQNSNGFGLFSFREHSPKLGKKKIGDFDENGKLDIIIMGKRQIDYQTGLQHYHYEGYEYHGHGFIRKSSFDYKFSEKYGE